MPDQFHDFPQPILPPQVDSDPPAAFARPKVGLRATHNAPRQQAVAESVGIGIEVRAPPRAIPLTSKQPQKSQLAVIGITVVITLTVTAAAACGFLMIRQQFSEPQTEKTDNRSLPSPAADAIRLAKSKSPEPAVPHEESPATLLDNSPVSDAPPPQPAKPAVKPKKKKNAKKKTSAKSPSAPSPSSSPTSSL